MKAFSNLLEKNYGVWWMPRLERAMKDVAICDKFRGADKQALIRKFPNGETPVCKAY
jgi:hypothetical protein